MARTARVTAAMESFMKNTSRTVSAYEIVWRSKMAGSRHGWTWRRDTA